MRRRGKYLYNKTSSKEKHNELYIIQKSIDSSCNKTTIYTRIIY